MKSSWTSTFSFSDHSLTMALVTSLAPGTQWSHRPIVILPAAPAVRANGAATVNAAAAAPDCRSRRRSSSGWYLASIQVPPWIQQMRVSARGSPHRPARAGSRRTIGKHAGVSLTRIAAPSQHPAPEMPEVATPTYGEGYAAMQHNPLGRLAYPL